MAEDHQARTRFSVSCVAVGDTGLQTGFESSARTVGFELFDEVSVEELAQIAARRALSKLSARPAPSGELPVVLAGGSGGILFHEACGHGLEADHIVKDASVYTGMVGQQVASPLVTLVDDGTVRTEWGTFGVDDEGRPAQRNVLIDNGVLTDYLWDYLRARKEGRASSGNGRRQTYQHLPMVRMTNTFLLPGEEDADEIVAQTPRGVYVAKLGGGQVNTTTGDFVFGTTEAYLIEEGRITEPLRDANLIGNGPEILKRIDAVATDFGMTPGTCGKDGQSVPGGMRAGHHASDRGDHRGDGGVSTVTDPAPPPTDGGPDELVDLADRVAGWAEDRRGHRGLRGPGGRDGHPRLRRGGRVADLGHLGRHRHPGGRRPPARLRLGRFARRVGGGGDAGTRPGTTPRSPLPTSTWRWRCPTGWPPCRSTCGTTAWPRSPPPAKVELALALEAQARAADPRIRQVDQPTTATPPSRWPWSRPPESARRAGRPRATCRWGSSPARATAARPAAATAWAAGSTGSTPTRAVGDAVKRAVRMLGATKGPSGRSTVVFDRRVASTLLSVVSSALSGEAVAKGRSFFAGRIGELVADPVVTLVDDPTDPRAYGAAAYDAEGLACRRNVLIDAGVLRGFLYDTVSASRAGVASTGSAVRGGFAGTPGPVAGPWPWRPGAEGYDEDGVLAAVGDGLFVQSMTGVHSGVNPISGDFSVGAEGLMIRDGKLAEPVREITVASTLQRMLQSLEAVGADVEWLPGIAAGQTLAIGDMQISGV